MGQVSRSWQPSDLVIHCWYQPRRLKSPNCPLADRMARAISSQLPGYQDQAAFHRTGDNWMNEIIFSTIQYCIHRILWIFIHCWLGDNNHLCRSLWPIASIFSTGILCIFFFASLCSSIPFFAPATSSAKSLWFRSSLQYVCSTHGPVTFLLNGIITWERLPHVFQSIQKVTWLP